LYRIETEALDCLIAHANKLTIVPAQIIGKMPFNARSTNFKSSQRLGTIEQVNQITSEIRTTIKHREYCSVIFLDVSQAFNRVKLKALMHKIITLLPKYKHKLLDSYWSSTR